MKRIRDAFGFVGAAFPASVRLTALNWAGWTRRINTTWPGSTDGCASIRMTWAGFFALIGLRGRVGGAR